jgi:hypothetical protein
MSEAVYLSPRIAPTTDLNSCKQFVKNVAFGTAGLVVSAKLGRLYKCSVVNSAATRYFLQFHDKATAPVNADVPVWEVDLPASGGAKEEFGLSGYYFANGISIAISSTKGALTLALATDCTAYALYTATTT